MGSIIMRSTRIITIAIIIALTVAFNAVSMDVGAECVDSEEDDVIIAEVVYTGDDDFISKNYDYYTQIDDTVNYQLVVFSAEEYPDEVDIRQVIEDVNDELAEEGKGIYLRSVDDPQMDEGVGYMTNNKGQILPLKANDNDQHMSGTITAKEAQVLIDDRINDAVYDQVVESSQRSTSAMKSAWYINISLKTSYDADKNRVKATATRVGVMPSPAKLTLRLQNKLTGGSYSTVKDKAINKKTTKSGSVKYGTTKTRIWRATVKGRLGDADVTYSTNAFVYNKKCIRYPSYKEVYSNKALHTPPTNLKVKQNARSTSFRKNYIADFKKKYPKAKIKWENYDIHHMRPLKYGGTNAVSNGFTATKTQHKSLNSWWANY